MKLADVSIQRPVFAFMMTIALVTLGLFSYRDLGLDLMPKTDQPNVMVMTSLPGASAEEIETQITKPVEEVVNTINGVDEISCGSSLGRSHCFVTFLLEKDIDIAVQDVRDKVATIVRGFPRDTYPPEISKMDPDAEPILSIVISAKRTPKEITEITDKKIKEVLETVKNVGDVTFRGDRRREIQLLLNADRLRAYNITVEQVRQAIQRQNVEVPGGSFIAGPSEIGLRTMGRIQKVEDFNHIILAYREGSTIVFSDIGRVVDTVEEPRSVARLDGVQAVSLQIRKQSGTNTVEVVDAVMARLERIKTTLPADFRIQAIRDQSRFIRRSVEDIQHHIILGGILASIVVFLFIRNLRSTIIAAIAIPASIIGTFTVMKALGFTMNNMTMLALSLATGIVIDDAIVVLENIFRFVEEKGMAPREAASKATAEIGLAVMATTISLVVIFLPVAFMSGQVGRYFYSFGITSAVAIMISMFISFTLTPALCAVWLRKKDFHGPAHGQTKQKGLYAAMDRGYGHMLEWSLRHRFVLLLIAAGVSLSAILLMPYIGQELVPDDDQSEYSINLRLPKGTSFERTNAYSMEVENMVRKLPEVVSVYTNVDPGGISLLVELTNHETRKQTQQDLMRQARMALRRFQGARISVSGGTDLSGASSAGYRGGSSMSMGNRLYLLIQGPEIEQLQTYTTQLLQKLRKVPGMVDADTRYEATQPELKVNVDRIRAADLGANIDSLASSLRSLVGGEEVSRYKEGDEQYYVRLRLDQEYRNNPEKMGDLLVPTNSGRTVKVSDVAQLHMGYGPADIDRYNRQRQISVMAGLDRLAMGTAVEIAKEKVEELNLKPGYQVVFRGSARTLSQASNDFVLAIFLAVAFIYMVLASQFNSFVHPLTIMTALPLSFPAGLLALMAFGMTLNVYSAIGLMMLFGIVKKNSILQVDYTNTLRSQGMERHHALIQANHVRLRPILMTTISIIAGMLPIAFGRGAGAGSRASMAVTIIGGQILCLLLTLLITPVIYSYFDDLREWSPLAWLSRLFRRSKPAVSAQSAPMSSLSAIREDA